MGIPRRMKINFLRLRKILRDRCISCGRVVTNNSIECVHCAKRGYYKEHKQEGKE